MGYERPTPIQREAIPPLLAGRDLIGRAADQRKGFADMPLVTDNWKKYVPRAS